VDITCGRCRRSYFVPDDLVQGRTFRAKCSQCGHAFAVDVAAARGGKGRPRRAEPPPVPDADSLPSTSASAIPGFADTLADADLGWLDEAAAKADAHDEQVFLLTVQRGRRGNAVAVVAGALLLVAAAAGIVVWMKTRSRVPELGARSAPAAEVAPLAVQDAGALAARPPEPEPAAEGASAEPAPGARRPARRRLALDDRRLLDLLARKEDATVAGPGEDEDAVESARSALDPAAAEKVIAGNRRAFDACVSKALRLNPDLKLARRATMVITVQPDGRVSEAALAEEQIARSDLGVCLAEAAGRMVFPGFDGEPLDIAMPLSLSAAY
jgi:hypothetical protein